jgi:hypothetical protein
MLFEAELLRCHRPTHAKFLRRNSEPVEPLRPDGSAEIGQREESPDAVGDRDAGDIDPVGRGHRTAELQLIGLAGDGGDGDEDVGAGLIDCGDLIGG